MLAETMTDVDALWDRYFRNRTSENRNRLVEHYLYLVKIVAGRLAVNLPTHVDKEDLLSSGVFGLMEAIDRYDSSRKNKFETYAGVRVRGAMLDYLRSKDWIPVTLRQKIRRYEKAVYELETEFGRSATDEEIAERMGISVLELPEIEMQLNAATVVPLEEYIRTGDMESMELSPSDSMELKEIQSTLATAIDKLPEKERLVVSLYYYEELTLKEISLIMHLTEARISQLHTKAVFRLRGQLARMKANLL
ncbi:MAG: FliA/WhiG family RNA polymerase sigma factor [Selenomonadaceae bacterium]|nr:FliA/WhiG family RNA polymerase sigma factor [Selenomonadaceae bacterium]MBR3723230.1 FliA/WhiG family RNA polymerase sigma factor [Selenomonadaceae bacterium]